MTSTTTLFSTLSLWLFLSIVVANLGFCYPTAGQGTNQTTHQTRCIPTEREALLEFKQHLTDPSNRLATWTAAADDDCCNWYGVSCHDYLGDSTTQYVTGLHLESLSQFEFYSGESKDYGAYLNTIFGGKVSSSLLSLKHLSYLDLSYNDFGGINIPSFLGSMRSLRYLNLSSAGFEGMIPHQLGNLSNLQYLNLGFNNLSGTLPINLGRLQKLEKLYLDGNSLTGEVSEVHFENLTNLQVFVASMNQLKLRVSPNWIPPFDQLVVLHLRSWYIGLQFPTWLHSLKNLYSLDLSSSGISSTIPVWFWNFSSNFNDLDLSHNQLHGVLPNTLSQFSFVRIEMSSNRLHGPLPLISSNLYELDLSNNSFSGSISKFLCPPNFNSSGVSQNLLYLNLGQNHLQGEIPNCLAAWPELSVINLSNNKLNGTIPESIGTLKWLQSLHLGNNRLSGELPQSLKECTNLITVNVGENKLVGNISNFVSAESLSGMKILILRSNKLSGELTEKLCHAASLYILDLANNLFHGIIPSCLGNLSAMATMNKSTGLIQASRFGGMTMESALLGLKGSMLEYSKNIGFVRSLDFSNNRLGGTIPDEITSLHGLIFLNLSRNALKGKIPKNIGFLKELESMDLSANQLSGEIPQSISNLASLGTLNLSHNKLSGRIPSGIQIQTFDASSFSGNELCGSPLPNKCSNNVVPNDGNDKGGGDD